MGERTFLYLAASTNEQVVYAGRCRLWAVRPNLTWTGTLTLRKGAAGGSDVFSVSAIGLTQAGKDFDGVVLESGFTAQLSVATDLGLIVFEPF